MKAIFFDFDGVLTTDKTGSLTTLRYMSEHTGIGIERLAGAFGKFNEALNLGLVTHDEIWPSLCAALGAPIDKALLLPAFESTPMNPQVLELARRLKQTHAVGIITDNKKDRIDHLKQHLALAALFDPIAVSAEIGFDKTSPVIFQRALDDAAIAASESIFIDNAKENLVVANALGMHTVHFDDETKDVCGLVRTLRDDFGVGL